MTRTGTAVAAALLAVLVLPGAPAVAATSANVQSPQAQSTVSSPTAVRVQVSSDSGGLTGGEQVSRVEVRLSADGRETYPGTTIVDLDCSSGCGSESSVWTGGSYDPATGAPFAGAGTCNGRYYVQPRVNGGSWGAGIWFVSSAAPAKVIGLRLSATDSSVTVQWSGNTEPDLAGYVVERSRDGGPFIAMADVPAGSTSFVDEGLGHGEYTYRVVAARPDGRDGSSPAAPCTDDGAELRSTSEARTVQVGSPPEPEPEPTDGSSDGGSTDGGSSDGSSTGGSSDGSATDGSGDTSDGAAAGDDGSPTTDGQAGSSDAQSDDGDDDGAERTRSGRRVSAPPRARRSTSQELTLPNLSSSGSRSPADDRYYGEDDPYSDELNYGEAPQVAGAPESSEEPAYRTERLDGQTQTFAQRIFDAEAHRSQWRAVAGGLLLVLLALHLQRWAKSSDG